jgi:hypothetical protein
MIEASIEDRDDGAMATFTAESAIRQQKRRRAAFARAFPCGHRGI